jgi:hypothetical protein
MSQQMSVTVPKLWHICYQGSTDIEEEFLFCHMLPTITTGEDIFEMVDSFFKEVLKRISAAVCALMVYQLCQVFVPKVK